MLTVLPLFALTSCNDDDDELQPGANVMVVHASPDAPSVDLLIDDKKVNTSALSYPNNTGYLSVSSGTRNVKVNAAGTSTTVINGNLDLESGRSYSVFAINTLSNIEPLILEDDLASPANGRAHVRFLHLSPDAPAVDIAVQNGPTLFSNRAFKSATAFTPVDAGTYTLEVRLAGTNTTVLTVPNVMLENGAIYTVFAQGFANPASGNTNTLGAGAIRNN